MLLCGIIDEIQEECFSAKPFRYFFCQATEFTVNTVTAVLRRLIYSLVEECLLLISYVRARYDQAGRGFFEDASAWVDLSDIFMDMIPHPMLWNAYLIVDALDGFSRLPGYISESLASLRKAYLLFQVPTPQSSAATRSSIGVVLSFRPVNGFNPLSSKISRMTLSSELPLMTA